jgi:hypothetical protein
MHATSQWIASAAGGLAASDDYKRKMPNPATQQMITEIGITSKFVPELGFEPIGPVVVVDTLGVLAIVVVTVGIPAVVVGTLGVVVIVVGT